MNWCFAIINNKIAEVYFEREFGKITYFDHCYIHENDYKTKEEEDYLKRDTAHIKLVYRNGLYKRI